MERGAWGSEGSFWSGEAGGQELGKQKLKVLSCLCGCCSPKVSQQKENPLVRRAPGRWAVRGGPCVEAVGMWVSGLLRGWVLSGCPSQGLPLEETRVPTCSQAGGRLPPGCGGPADHTHMLRDHTATWHTAIIRQECGLQSPVQRPTPVL